MSEATPTSTPIYKRVLLKLSGEALQGDSHGGICPKTLDRFASDIASVCALGIEVGVVIGGGNLFRGKVLSESGLGRVTGDHMGMLATVMNGLALRDALERIDLPARIMSAIPMTGVVDPYNRRKAIMHLRDKRVVIFTAGTGNPFFTTDTAACLRAIEVDADVVLKATKVDGVYSADPIKYPDAERFHFLTYQDVLIKDLKVMDMTAICLCQEQNMPLRIFDINEPHALINVVTGYEKGTTVGAKNDK